MTTLVGMASGKDKSAVVLASDLSGIYSSMPSGNVAYTEETRHSIRKIYVDDDGELAVSMTGIMDSHYKEFLLDLLRGKIDVRAAIMRGAFTELSNLNLGRWGGKVPTPDSNELLIATRFENEPRLYTCFPLGAIEERYLTAIGSGSRHALNYLRERQKIGRERTTFSEALDSVVGSLEEATKDIYTGGLDLVVVTPERIYQYGDRIKEVLEAARETAVRSIKRDISRSE